MNHQSVNKAKYLHDILKLDIENNKYVVGEKLPSVRDLASQYNVNKSTVVTVLATLASEGLVKTEAGKGAFVLKQKVEQKQIAVLMFELNSPMRVDTEILGFIQKNIKPGYYLSLHETSQNYKVFERKVASLVEDNVKGIIAIPPKFYTPSQSEVDYLNQVLGDIPIVFIVRNIEGVLADFYSMDLNKGIQKVITYLHSIGKKNICLIKHDSQKFIDEEMAGLEVSCSKFQITMNPDFLLEYDSNVERIGNTLKSIIDRIDAIIAPDYLLCSLQGIFRESRKRIPEELSIVGINDVVSQYFSPPLTSICFPVEQIGMNTIDTLMSRIDGKLPAKRVTQNFVPDLIIRET